MGERLSRIADSPPRPSIRYNPFRRLESPWEVYSARQDGAKAGFFLTFTYCLSAFMTLHVPLRWEPLIGSDIHVIIAVHLILAALFAVLAVQAHKTKRNHIGYILLAAYVLEFIAPLTYSLIGHGTPPILALPGFLFLIVYLRAGHKMKSVDTSEYDSRGINWLD